MTPGTRYDLARNHALLAGLASQAGSGVSPAEGRAEADQAMAELKRSYAAGFHNPNMDTDTDLDSLRAESARLEAVSGPSRERLDRAIADIERRLDQAGDDEPDTLVERLREDLSHFEVEHPTVAAALKTVLNTLSNAGI